MASTLALLYVNFFPEYSEMTGEQCCPVTSCRNFRKYHDTKSKEVYLNDELVQVEKWHKCPHLSVMEAMGGLWSRFPDLCSDHRTSTLLINPTVVWMEVK